MNDRRRHEDGRLDEILRRQEKLFNKSDQVKEIAVETRTAVKAHGVRIDECATDIAVIRTEISGKDGHGERLATCEANIKASDKRSTKAGALSGGAVLALGVLARYLWEKIGGKP